MYTLCRLLITRHWSREYPHCKQHHAITKTGTNQASCTTYHSDILYFLPLKWVPLKSSGSLSISTLFYISCSYCNVFKIAGGASAFLSSFLKRARLLQFARMGIIATEPSWYRLCGVIRTQAFVTFLLLFFFFSSLTTSFVGDAKCGYLSTQRSARDNSWCNSSLSPEACHWKGGCLSHGFKRNARMNGTTFLFWGQAKGEVEACIASDGWILLFYLFFFCNPGMTCQVTSLINQWAPQKPLYNWYCAFGEHVLTFYGCHKTGCHKTLHYILSRTVGDCIMNCLHFIYIQ